MRPSTNAGSILTVCCGFDGFQKLVRGRESLSVHIGYLVGGEERNVATVQIFTPSSPRLHPRSGLGERAVSDSQPCHPSLPHLTDSIPPSPLDRYFCEPAYEKFRGTGEGALNSRLYNEKAYVLSRGFILRALEIPPGSLEDEIRGFYLSSLPPEGRETEGPPGHDQGHAEGSSQGRRRGRGRLEKVLKGSKDLISLSQALHGSQTQCGPLSQAQPPASETGPSPVPDEAPAIPSLTAGGILSLQRVLSKLSNIQANSSQSSPEFPSTPS
jgi:hypothetical protein